MGASGAMPVLVGVPPGGSADFGDASVDADDPFAQVQGAVVEPAQQYPVADYSLV